MKPSTLMIIGGLLLVASAFIGKSEPVPDIVPVPVPSASMQALVAPITAKLQGNAEAARKLQAFYSTFADVVERDSAAKLIQDNHQLRQHHTDALTLMLQGSGWVDLDVSKPINDAMTSALGLKAGPVDRVKAVEVLRAIAWGCK